MLNAVGRIGLGMGTVGVLECVGLDPLSWRWWAIAAWVFISQNAWSYLDNREERRNVNQQV